LEDLFSVIKPGFQAVELYVIKRLAGAFLPAFFIAGGIATFIPRHTIIRFLARGVSPLVSYPISLVAGGVLSVCACGILPLFQTIYQRGAGIGPAITFLYAGPAINVIAILFTFQLLGSSLGFARLLFVPVIALGLGFFLSRVFADFEDRREGQAEMALVGGEKSSILSRTMLFIFLMGMVITLPLEQISWEVKGPLNLVFLLVVVGIATTQLSRLERINWLDKSFFLLKNIVPKLILGVFIVGLLEPHARVLMVDRLMDNGFVACLLASVIGGILYLGTILGVIAVKGLTTMGMPDGPALALLLSGPTIALPSVFVITSICGFRISAAFCTLVILTSAVCGYFFAGGWIS
jgi:uncharacterized protein